MTVSLLLIYPISLGCAGDIVSAGEGNSQWFLWLFGAPVIISGEDPWEKDDKEMSSPYGFNLF